MANIFVSYLFETDLHIAQPIISTLEAAGHKVFEMPVDWYTEIFPNIEKLDSLFKILDECEIFISVVTPEFFDSLPHKLCLTYAEAYANTSLSLTILQLGIGVRGLKNSTKNSQIVEFAKGTPSEDVASTLPFMVANILGKMRAQETKSAKIEAKIEANAAAFIDEEIRSLKEREHKNARLGTACNLAGVLALLAGAFVGATGISALAITDNFPLVRAVFIGIKSLVVTTLLIASSKYTFILGKSYMVEALKYADRIHAISFGRFYLRTFGANATWEELKEVFQHWNINNASSFSNLDPTQYDPKFLEAFLEFSKNFKPGEK